MKLGRPRRGRFFQVFVGWLALVTLAEVFVFHHYNAQLSVVQVPISSNTTRSAASKKTNTDFKKIGRIGPHELRSKLFGLSPDGSKFAYVDTDNDFVIIDTKTGHILTQSTLSYKADYLEWFNNNHLFVGTENPNGSLKNIRFSTYDLTSKSFHLWQVYTGYRQTASLENVTFSPFTNDTYVLLGDPNSSVEYHFDTNNHMWHYNLSGRTVQDWLVSQTSDQLYYQDIANGIPNIWVYDYRSVSSHLVAKRAKLLSMNSNTLYYASLNSSGDVTAINEISDWNKGSKKVLTLSTPTLLSSIFVDGNNFYQIGSNKLTNLQTQATVSMPSHQKTIVAGGNLYVIGSDGNVYYYHPNTQTAGANGTGTGSGANSAGGNANAAGSATGSATGSASASNTTSSTTGT